jgi:hypothetical protein
MREIAKDCKVLVEKAGGGNSSLYRLYEAIDAYKPQGGS